MTTPMTSQNPVPWLLWLGFATLIVVSTRNPYYLTLALIAVLSVYAGLDRQSQISQAWTTILRIGLVIAAISVLFNVLTVHSGNRRFAAVPDQVPVFGGPLTLNALAYGLVSALALITLLLIAATFSAAVDRATLIRLFSNRYRPIALALLIAISIFPQTLQSLRDVRDAQRARGFRFRSVRDFRSIIVPVLNLGLQKGFDLAETIHTRRPVQPATRSPRVTWLIALALGSIGSGVILFGLAIVPTLIPILLVISGFGLLLSSMRSGTSHDGASFRPILWTPQHVFEVAMRCAGITTLIVELTLRSERLAFTPYPWLEWPSFHLLPALAIVTLVTPALAQPVRQQTLVDA